VVDALSRRAHETHIPSINMFNIDLNDRIIEAKHLDKKYLKIKEKLHEGKLQ
jgi:hypothetical protein